MKITEPCNAPCGHCGGTGDEPDSDHHSNDTLDAMAWALGRVTIARMPDICCVCDGDGRGSVWVPYGHRHRPGEEEPRPGRPFTRGAIHRSLPSPIIIDELNDLAREPPSKEERQRVIDFFKQSMLGKSIVFPKVSVAFATRKPTT